MLNVRDRAARLIIKKITILTQTRKSQKSLKH